MHTADHLLERQAIVANVEIVELLGNDSDDFATNGEASVGDDAHESYTSAAID